MTDLKTVVVHSGGMDSSICLYLAIKKYGADSVLSLGFSYGQRHDNELDVAKKIADHFKVKRVVIDLSCLNQITTNALMDKNIKIEHKRDEAPNTLVIGRNGLMARVAAIHAFDKGAKSISMGVIEIEQANSGYRDCSRQYMDIIEKALRLDFACDNFRIETPLVKMTKLETMEVIEEYKDLEFLLENTITCYEGISKEGCGRCPACKLRNKGITDYLDKYPHRLNLSFTVS
ncbi:MAG: 7-cyano-7-deazaguanine synthase QueC [Bacteriovoracaceae bacterium]|jgi:7-cyano-7-deazaguanine synthase|nr:7-cyano-7-deazaguanine synthase QueC [Bacteriovoracaceae bacterium]